MQSDPPFDVIVYTATAGGVVAAIAAAREGARVALLEPGRHVGGMVSGGLGWTDVGDHAVIGGMALEFYERVANHYHEPVWAHPGPEPHVAEAIFRDWLREAGVHLFFGSRLDHVVKERQTIRGVTIEGNRAFEASVYIDASYEGDLVARAGVSYAVGRESVSAYGESWAGRQPIRPGQHQLHVPVSPFVNGKDGELLPLIHDKPMVVEGEGDGGVQSYCFRLCLTNRPEDQVTFPKPDDYDPSQLELLRRFLAVAGQQVQANRLMGLRPNLPNGKCDVNSIGPISTSLLDGSNWAYPDANYSKRQEIWDHHLHYTQSLLYFLANDESVPAHIRAEMNTWGLCHDEFQDTGHWPHQLYVRDARRMYGEYFMSQADLEGANVKYDSIGMGAYNIDIREVQRTWMWVPRYPNVIGETFNEGYLTIPVKPYQIPYRSLVPKYYQCSNLLVTVCVSASHVAFGSIRMEPQYMIMGHAAGVAAAMAARENQAVQRIAIASLQQKLAAQRQVLEQP